MKINMIVASLLIMFLLGGCAMTRSGSVYTSGQALQAEDVAEGVIESAEPATIRKDGTIIGDVGGAIIGGIAASTIGGGKGKQLATAGGAIIGGLLGHFLEQGITDKKAVKLVVKMNNGDKIVIVQEADVIFQPGERVNVFSSRVDNTKRVSKL
jgi:outer membrane lipoprotein SlyB